MLPQSLWKVTDTQAQDARSGHTEQWRRLSSELHFQFLNTLHTSHQMEKDYQEQKAISISQLKLHRTREAIFGRTKSNNLNIIVSLRLMYLSVNILLIHYFA